MEEFNHVRQSPIKILISFKKLISYYQSQLEVGEEHNIANAQYILNKIQDYPILNEGFEEIQTLEEHRPQIDILFKDMFSAPLSPNEIKMATIPYHNYRFYSSKRFRSILKDAGEDFELKIDRMSDDEFYKVACTVVLRAVYGFDVSYKRPFTYDIPDKNGVMRNYKILYNADFVEFEKTDEAPEITEKDYNELLDSFNDVEIWKKKFPPDSYILKGFVLANMIDVTDDQSISSIKTSLIAEGKRQDKAFIIKFKEIFRSLFGVKDIDVGFLTYDKEKGTFERVFGKGISSYLLNNQMSQKCNDTLCNRSFDIIINKKETYSISDVDKYFKLSKGKSPQYKSLKEQGIKSAILAPIANNDEILGILELVSRTPKLLNSVSGTRLVDVMPFIVSSVERSKRDQENLIEAIIQQECTSIHNSVKWKFEEAALKYIQDSYLDPENVQFQKIVINDVYPLFGQIDVQGSSDARNLATQKDLSLQLGILEKIFNKIYELEKLPIYENLQHEISRFKTEIEEELKVDSEQLIHNFVHEDIHPILNYQLNKNAELNDVIDDYFKKLDGDLEVVYYYRKNYDDAVALINQNMSHLLDQKQHDAQSYYPHYFERYKTDGVEHNMYIGNEITKNDDFNKVYLYNLRLWQMQIMCEMENEYYQNKHLYPLSLDVASMILVFGRPLSIRFRMDEKKFDVDGTYNARYEVVKKRVDKANIKGTEERITQKGKLTIVISRKEDELEYLRYIKFLQSKNILGPEVEILELEDLQGVTGLNAIRVNILYHKPDEKEFYTYEDLMDTLAP